jgi:hypothetical protein
VGAASATGPGLSRQGADLAGQAAIGILSLETRFPRIPGDVGNALTWPFPVMIRAVSGASPGRVVAGRAEGLLDAFADAGNELVAEGAAGIVTTCGFLVLMQAALQARIPVPVATSALLQAPLLERLLPAGTRVGIVTACAASLSPDHLAAAGLSADAPVEGVAPSSHFADVFLRDAASLDAWAAERDVVDAAATLVSRRPDVAALVLECANMPPYAAVVRRATGLPVYDAVSFVAWFRAGLVPACFPAPVR